MSVADAALMMNVLKRPTRATGPRCRTTRATTRSASTTASAACASPSRRRSATPRTSHPEVAAAVAAAVAQLAGARRARRSASIPASTIRSRSPPASGSPARMDDLERPRRRRSRQLTDPDFRAEAELGAQLQRARRPAPAPAPRRARLAHAPVHAALRPARDAGGRGAGVRRAAGRAHADGRRRRCSAGRRSATRST